MSFKGVFIIFIFVSLAGSCRSTQDGYSLNQSSKICPGMDSDLACLNDESVEFDIKSLEAMQAQLDGKISRYFIENLEDRFNEFGVYYNQGFFDQTFEYYPLGGERVLSDSFNTRQMTIVDPFSEAFYQVTQIVHEVIRSPAYAEILKVRLIEYEVDDLSGKIGASVDVGVGDVKAEISVTGATRKLKMAIFGYIRFDDNQVPFRYFVKLNGQDNFEVTDLHISGSAKATASLKDTIYKKFKLKGLIKERLDLLLSSVKVGGEIKFNNYFSEVSGQYSKDKNTDINLIELSYVNNFFTPLV